MTLPLLTFKPYRLLLVSAIYSVCVCVRACEAGFVASFEVTSRQAECYLIIPMIKRMAAQTA